VGDVGWDGGMLLLRGRGFKLWILGFQVPARFWLWPGGFSPYYTENHCQFRAQLRKFVEEELKVRCFWVLALPGVLVRVLLCTTLFFALRFFDDGMGPASAPRGRLDRHRVRNWYPVPFRTVQRDLR
jgi:hypothetical protein